MALIVLHFDFKSLDPALLRPCGMSSAISVLDHYRRRKRPIRAN